MATSFKTTMSIKAVEGVVRLTTTDGEGNLVAQIRLTPEQAIHQAQKLLNAGFAAKSEGF